MNDKLAIVLFSGTMDKLTAAANIAAGAAAAGREVVIFLTFAGLLAFRKNDWKTNRNLSGDLGSYLELTRSALQNTNMPSWMEILHTAREIGTLKIMACQMTLEMFNLKLDDLEPLVTELATVSDLLDSSPGGTAMFI